MTRLSMSLRIRLKILLAFMSYAEIIFVSAKTGQRLNKNMN